MWYLIFASILIIYTAINLALPRIFSGTFESYVMRPLLWIILAAITYLVARHEGINIWSFKKIRRWQVGNSPLQAALIIGGFQISLLVMAGLFVGFGKSPNIITPTSTIIFLFYIFSAIFGIELSRSYLIQKGTSGRKNATLAIGLIALLCMLIQIRLTDVLNLNLTEPLPLIEFIGATLIPLIAISLFASYIAYYGGALPAIAYMGILSGFEMFSPILPDLNWIMKAFIELMAPTIGFLLIQQSLQETTKTPKTSRKTWKKRDPTLMWVGTAVVCLLLVFFSFGYFGVQPTIISSGSMKPTLYTGDIVLVADADISEIQEGDIIQYEWHNFSTIHRVVQIAGPEGSDQKAFLTKGDANDDIDADPVTSEQVTGKVVFTIPKLGWIPLIFKTIIEKIRINI